MASSLLTFAIPRDYGYVLLTATTTFIVGIWHSFRTSPFRKAAGIPYPIPYAFDSPTDAATIASDPKAKAKYLFNCAQRAHGNFLENYPIFFPSMLIAGLKYPIAASVLGLTWNVGRVVYAVGYTSPQRTDGKGRLTGSFQYIGLFGCLILSGMVGYDVLMS